MLRLVELLASQAGAELLRSIAGELLASGRQVGRAAAAGAALG